MMGDIGLNVFGIFIGMFIFFGYLFNIRLGWLIFVVIMYIFIEKYLLIKIIEKNKLLNFIDKLGR